MKKLLFILLLFSMSCSWETIPQTTYYRAYPYMDYRSPYYYPHSYWIDYTYTNYGRSSQVNRSSNSQVTQITSTASRRSTEVIPRRQPSKTYLTRRKN